MHRSVFSLLRSNEANVELARSVPPVSCAAATHFTMDDAEDVGCFLFFFLLSFSPSLSHPLAALCCVGGSVGDGDGGVGGGSLFFVIDALV